MLKMKSEDAALMWSKRVGSCLAMLLLGGITSACNPVFAPPIRSVHLGSPRSTQPRAVEVSGAAGIPWGNGAATLSIPVAEGVWLDGSLDMRYLDPEQWTMGNVGVRFVLFQEPDKVTGFFADVELGAGAGVGGVDEREGPGAREMQWHERFAYGAFAGMGAAYHVTTWFAWFARGRVQVSKAEFIPTTLWASGVTGPQFTVGPVSLYLSMGAAYYLNDVDEEVGLLPEAGLSVRFPLAE